MSLYIDKKLTIIFENVTNFIIIQIFECSFKTSSIENLIMDKKFLFYMNIMLFNLSIIIKNEIIEKLKKNSFKTFSSQKINKNKIKKII